MKKKYILILFLLFLLLLVLYFIFFRNKISPNRETATGPNTVSETKQEGAVVSVPMDIIKCQNVVITPQVTTELFTYVSGKKVRMDYRMNATTEEKSGNHQAFYDGEWLYIWDRGVNDLAPVDGLKSRVVAFSIRTDTGELGVPVAFKSGQMSGDRMCNNWDDGSTVFEVPKNVKFVESSDVIKIWQERLNSVCTICGKVPDGEAPSVCQKNLSCK